MVSTNLARSSRCSGDSLYLCSRFASCPSQICFHTQCSCSVQASDSPGSVIAQGTFDRSGAAGDNSGTPSSTSVQDTAQIAMMAGSSTIFSLESQYNAELAKRVVMEVPLVA